MISTHEKYSKGAVARELMNRFILGQHTEMSPPPASEMQWVSDHPQGAVLRLRVVPRAPRDGIDGPHGDALKLRLTAPPVEGEANAALVRLLSRLLEVPRSSLHLLAGSTGRQKLLQVAGCGAAVVRARLAPHFTR